MSPRPLRLFLDSADPDEWERWLKLGVFHGLTTNPLLLERAGRPCTFASLEGLVARAVELNAHEIHLQAWGEEAGALVECGERLSALAPEVVVKLPATGAGLEAASQLVDEETQVTLTAIFDGVQVLAASALGCTYAAPFVGRIDDLGRDGNAEVCAMQAMLRRTGSPTRLLTASLRSWGVVVGLARNGLDTFTVSPEVAAGLVGDPHTEAAARAFEQAARIMGEVDD